MRVTANPFRLAVAPQRRSEGCESKSQPADTVETSYTLKRNTNIFTGAVAGAAVGAIVFSRWDMALGGALGTGLLGAGLCWWKVHDRLTGTLTVSIDGQTTSRPYEGSPQKSLTPFESQAWSSLAPACEIPSRKVDLDLQGPDKVLNDLAGQGRILVGSPEGSAPIGYRTSGQEAWEHRQLGQPLYLVTVDSQNISQHRMAISAVNSGKSSGLAEARSTQNHTIEYHVSQLTTLDDVPDGRGLPKGVAGVYLNRQFYSQTIATETSQAAATTEETLNQSSHKAKYSWARLVNPSATSPQSLRQTDDIRHRVTQTPDAKKPLALMIGIVGLAFGQKISPAATLVGGAVGAATGAFLGHLWNMKS